MNQSYQKTIIPVILTALISSSNASSNISQEALKNSEAPLDSFQYVRDRVFTSQFDTLPHYPGITGGDVLKLLVKKLKKSFSLFGDSRPDLDPNWDFAIRSRELLTDSANFKEPKVKWLHPRGACAEAVWQIDQDSQATGLFKKGTTVPAIIRISTGTHESGTFKENGEPLPRIFGMAVKLFHTPMTEDGLAQKAMTSNILTLDNFGFDRTDRLKVLQAENEEVFFTNVAPAKGTFGKVLSTALDLFDNPNWARPMYVTGSYDQAGNYIDHAITPFEVNFIPRFPNSSKTYSDFRAELIDQPESQGYFEIVIKSYEKNGQVVHQEIGKLFLAGKFITSPNCDLSLAFHHSPNEWKPEYR